MRTRNISFDEEIIVLRSTDDIKVSRYELGLFVFGVLHAVRLGEHSTSALLVVCRQMLVSQLWYQSMPT